MTPELIDLARAAVALPGWTWPAGMAYLVPDGHGGWVQHRILHHEPQKSLTTIATEGDVAVRYEAFRSEDECGSDDRWIPAGISHYPLQPEEDALPDFTDAATAGLLWQMLHAKDARLVTRQGHDTGIWGWLSCNGDPDEFDSYQWTRASCLGEACLRVARASGGWR